MSEVEAKDATKVIENSFFFGQYMVYFMIQQVIKTKGTELAMQFANKKMTEIAKANPAFAIQAEKIVGKLLDQYFTDSMESNETHIRPVK